MEYLLVTGAHEEHNRARAVVRRNEPHLPPLNLVLGEEFEGRGERSEVWEAR